jgi:hypothetical protein
MTEAARTSDSNENAVFGGNDSRAAATPKPGEAVGNGVFGFSMVPNASGVFGANNNGGVGVAGASEKNFGVRGDSTTGFAAVHGHGGKNGVWGLTNSAADSGVFGQNDGAGAGVFGLSKDGFGVRGDSTNGFAAVHGHGGKNGIWGLTNSAADSGVFGQNDGAGAGVFGFSKNGAGVRGLGKVAGRFEGDVEVTGDIRLVNADCAEEFDIVGLETVEPGTVMVLDRDGRTRPSSEAYDKCVVGVVSGGGDYKPGIVLDRRDTGHERASIALMGKVYCKVDADYGAIEVGNLLTTSHTHGHAMKASDHARAFGTVIGKALERLPNGRGLIPVLVALQ